MVEYHMMSWETISWGWRSNGESQESKNCCFPQIWGWRSACESEPFQNLWTNSQLFRCLKQKENDGTAFICSPIHTMLLLQNNHSKKIMSLKHRDTKGGMTAPYVPRTANVPRSRNLCQRYWRTRYRRDGCGYATLSTGKICGPRDLHLWPASGLELVEPSL